MSQVPPEGCDDIDTQTSGGPADVPDQSAEQPQAVTTDEAPASAQTARSNKSDSSAPVQQKQTVIARYGLMRRTGEFAHNLQTLPRLGTKVVVRTERGVELGEVLSNVCDETCYGCVRREDLAGYLKMNGPEYPFRRDGKVLRLANPQDVIDQRHLESSAREESTYCRQQIRELDLKMKLVTVEHLLGGERIIFYFAAEHRVDFRELVRRLANQYRTRIEMRQVGARDEARLVGDYERCGRQCCCQEFIKDLRPVSMRMAKMQKATLDPAKISGRCGRLMCCLRFEDAGYEELRHKLPKRNTYVRTEKLTGRVINTQILTQLVRLELPDQKHAVVPNEEIIERDLKAAPSPDQPRTAVKPKPGPPSSERPAVAEPAPTETGGDSAEVSEPTEAVKAESTPAADQPTKSKHPPRRSHKKHRRRQPPGKGQSGEPKTPGPTAEAEKPQNTSQDQKSPNRKRRRRKKKRSE